MQAFSAVVSVGASKLSNLVTGQTCNNLICYCATFWKRGLTPSFCNFLPVAIEEFKFFSINKLLSIEKLILSKYFNACPAEDIKLDHV